MLRTLGLALFAAVLLATTAGEARAQYGYGGYGWGGWGGGGETVQGSIARGLGYYNIGAGIYNEDTAVANSINTDTVMRWNQYLWQSQQEANQREYVRMARRQQTVNLTADTLAKRLRENPTPQDIADGDALNVILDQVTDPRIHSSSLRMANDPLTAEVVDDIPFQNASAAITLSLNQLASKGTWPLGLRGDEFAAERDGYQQAIAAALDEDENGEISPKTLANVRAAVARLRAKLEANPPSEVSVLVEAKNYVKTLTGMSRMLENPQTEKALAELKKIKKTSLGSLLGFMHFYNLRFAPAKTADQRLVYDQLYPMMTVLRDKVLKDMGDDAPPSRAQAKGPSTDFFQGMHLDHLEGKRPPSANVPK